LKIIAVCGSPVKEGNVSALLDEALLEYKGRSDIEIKKYELAQISVAPCKHCNWCLKKQTEKKFCSIVDDMARIYPELLDASGLIIATPVHFGRLSSLTSSFIDRLRVFVHGNITRGAMRNKVGGSLAVSWFRNAGCEMALMTINSAFYALGMVVASPDLGLWGAAAFSSIDGTGRKGESKLLVREDQFGIAQARSLAFRVAELASLLEAGKRSED